MHAVDAILVMQVRPRREPAAPDIADHIALSYSRAGACITEPRKVSVLRRDVAAMLENDRVAVTALRAAEQYFPVAGRADRGARRRRVVDTAMGTNRIEHGMATVRIEVRTD